MTVRNIVLLNVTIVGESPLLVNRTHAPDGRELDASAPVECKLYRDASGRVGIPSSMLMNALKRAGFRCKVHRKQLSRQSGSDVPYIIRLREDFLAIDPGFDVWTPYAFSHMDRYSGRKRRFVLPKFDPWRITVAVDVHLAVFPGLKRKGVHGLFEKAGEDTAGIGFLRPERGGPYGMFRIHSWEWGIEKQSSERVA